MIYYNKSALGLIASGAVQHVSARRLWTWAGFAGAWLSVRGLLSLGHALDDALFPGWREQRVEQPVFIFANGRSGTTHLHRLMSLDEERFAGFKLYQSMFNAVAYRRFLQAIDQTPGLHAVGRAGVDLINRRVFSGWEGIHEMGIDKEEEDEATFAVALETASVSLLNPFIDSYDTLGWLDGRPDEETDAFMDFYEAAVKKHLFASGGNRRFLNKNVFFAPRVRTMLGRFPDARFVYLVRHPYKALPSWLSMFYDKWRTHSPELPYDSPEAKTLAEMGFRYYRYALTLLRDLPPSRIHVVSYSDLVKAPIEVIERTYDWMGLDLTSDYRARLAATLSKQERYSSAHNYSLEQFGLDPQWVYEELEEVFEHFGFER